MLHFFATLLKVQVVHSKIVSLTAVVLQKEERKALMIMKIITLAQI